MIYTKNIKIPSNTTKSDCQITDIDVCYGTIKQANIDIPEGCSGLVGIKVLKGLYSLYPTLTENWFIGNDTRIQINDAFPLFYEPYLLTVQTYNLDDRYNHTVYLRFKIDFPQRDIMINNIDEFLGKE